MEKSKSTTPEPNASRTWERLEDFVREHVQRFIQSLLEEEVTELLGRTKSARREAVDAAPGYRNGYGKPRRLTLTSGTITVRQPRVRDLNERFVSRVLPLFKRRIKEVGELLPQLLSVFGGDPAGGWELWAAPPGRLLDLGRSLATEGVWDGSWLLLRPSPI